MGPPLLQDALRDMLLRRAGLVNPEISLVSPAVGSPAPQFWERDILRPTGGGRGRTRLRGTLSGPLPAPHIGRPTAASTPSPPLTDPVNPPLLSRRQGMCGLKLRKVFLILCLTWVIRPDIS